MPLTRYSFADTISGFFEFPTDNARAILPRHLEPVELHHGTSVLSVTAFDFLDSLVGPYRELVMAVVVAPLVRRGERLPKSALFPYVLATTTRAARDHAIECWHLPHWMEDVTIDFAREQGRMKVTIATAAAAVAELTIGEHSWTPVSHLYQSFMQQGETSYVADILMEGQQSEHEDESGRLHLHEHPFHGALGLADVSDIPFREVWMRDGVQSFQHLARLETA